MYSILKKIRIRFDNLVCTIVSWIAVHIWTNPIFVRILEWMASVSFLHSVCWTLSPQESSRLKIGLRKLDQVVQLLN